MRPLLTCVPLLALLACAGHSTGGQSPEGLKTTAETFLRQVRWRDYGGAAGLLVPEKRDAFQHDRRVHHDTRDLEITDYELEEISLAPDAMTGKAIARMSWTRIPSVTVQTEDVETDFVYRDGHWLVTRMDGGPFDDLR